MTAQPTIKGIGHASLVAANPKALAEFYQAVLGLDIVGVSGLNTDKVHHSVFLGTRSAADHHQLEIFANPDHQYIAIEVESLADLRAFNQRVVDRGLPIRWTLNHGVSLAFYFADPVDNLINLYWPTGDDYPQTHGHPLDLTASEAALRQDVADLVAQRKELKGG